MSKELYNSKKTTVQNATVSLQSNSTIMFAMAAGAPPALVAEVAERVRSNALKDVTVYFKIASPEMAATLLTADVMEKINLRTFYIADIDRAIMKRQHISGGKQIEFIPCNFSQIPKIIRESIDIHTFMVTVSSMDAEGYFSFGTNNDFTSMAARHAKNLIVEVNEHMPRVFGQSKIHVSEVTTIVENHNPMPELPEVKLSPVDFKIGELIASLVPNCATIQLGIGKIPIGVAHALKNHKDLGLHTELFIPEMVELIEQGVVTGRYKNIHPEKHVFTFALGNKGMYEFLNNNPSIESYSCDYVNAVSTIAQHDNFVAINTAIEIDLYGQVNAEFIAGHQYTGSGGQFDFVKGATLSKGGKSIIGLRSTANEDKVSTIVPTVSMVTDPRTEIEFIVTEYGSVNLRGKSTRERASELIKIAHPKFREELTHSAKKLNLL